MTIYDQFKQQILTDGLDLQPSQAVCELQEVPRPWYERLFQRPWKPTQRTKTVYVPLVKVDLL